MRVFAILAALQLAAAVPSAGAQRLGPEVPRPRLGAAADSNDALAFLEHGFASITENTTDAARAFYWAARLDPSSPGALYGRRVALLMERPRELTQYMEGGRRAQENKTFLAIDSLQLRALQLDPLMYRSLDRALLFAYYYNIYRTREGGTLSRAAFDRELQYALAGEAPATRAWVLYGAGQFEQAVAQFDEAISRARNNSTGLRIEKARTLSLRDRNAEAITEFSRAYEALKARDERRGEYVVFYNSKALLQFSIGMLHVRMNALDSARAAFGRAMEEDISYWPPHVELGRLALKQQDSVTAVSELGLAAELATDEPYIQYMYGEMLHATGQHVEAAAALKKAIDLEPYYALPHFVLGQALEKAGDGAAARTHYARFLQLSSSRDAQRRTTATARLNALPR